MADEGLQWVWKQQNEVDCKTADVVQIVSGYDGGVGGPCCAKCTCVPYQANRAFARTRTKRTCAAGSKFDHVLRYFMAAVAEGKVVVVTGDMDPYSNSTECKSKLRKGWNCFFRQPSKCAKELDGTKLPMYRVSPAHWVQMGAANAPR